MNILSETGLSLEDIAMLADGIGVSDEAAKRYAPLVRTDPRLAEPLAELQQIAEDAGSHLLEDGLSAHRDFGRLESGTWDHPAEVLDASVGICYEELISLATARARRAEGAEKERLMAIQARLQAAHTVHQAEEEFEGKILDHLLGLDGDQAGALLRRLAEQHRLRRQPAESPPQDPGSDTSANGSHSIPIRPAGPQELAEP